MNNTYSINCIINELIFEICERHIKLKKNKHIKSKSHIEISKCNHIIHSSKDVLLIEEITILVYI